MNIRKFSSIPKSFYSFYRKKIVWKIVRIIIWDTNLKNKNVMLELITAHLNYDRAGKQTHETKAH